MLALDRMGGNISENIPTKDVVDYIHRLLDLVIYNVENVPDQLAQTFKNMLQNCTKYNNTDMLIRDTASTIGLLAFQYEYLMNACFVIGESNMSKIVCTYIKLYKYRLRYDSGHDSTIHDCIDDLNTMLSIVMAYRDREFWVERLESAINSITDCLADNYVYTTVYALSMCITGLNIPSDIYTRFSDKVSSLLSLVLYGMTPEDYQGWIVMRSNSPVHH